MRVAYLIDKNTPRRLHAFDTLRTGDADLRFLHYNCAKRLTQICVFNTRLFSLHNTLNYAIHRACLRMVLPTDVSLQRTLFIYLINKYISLFDICLTVHH